MKTSIQQLVAVLLNRQVANWVVLYVKLHNFHWNVNGPNFFTLHEKFEELYTEASGHIDTLAERVLSIGGSPIATLAASLEEASIKEATGGESAAEMVSSVVNDFVDLVGELKVARDVADEADDEATADMLDAIEAGLEKHVWMLEAFLE
uniref:DNA protection during starvation protein n=1 Tax=Brevibacillus brevis TaxID=1393 RepID=DPS_BREBE|nr:RecName: Full=DNA protection during starvation protein [Brevibacillus brevis]1N1Q_A Chain A, DPS Protein [Brevibacillus brevis]1N1Q_B Chain B, DPS Protein [Brevibacillus brevis]1N1Q_C Chain C, DPS Protein [Brevibacillus brevis]1N1Q_D Chain D, DPS Protein [Brevibacillus brevis]